MNAVEIEEAISALAEQPFDAAEFPFALRLRMDVARDERWHRAHSCDNRLGEFWGFGR